jgi:hypothetical protein
MINRIGRAGYACARARCDKEVRAAAPAALRRNRRRGTFMTFPSLDWGRQSCAEAHQAVGRLRKKQLYDSSVALDLTFLRMTRGNAGRNVDSATPEQSRFRLKRDFALRFLFGA